MRGTRLLRLLFKRSGVWASGTWCADAREDPSILPARSCAHLRPLVHCAPPSPVASLQLEAPLQAHVPQLQNWNVSSFVAGPSGVPGRVAVAVSGQPVTRAQPQSWARPGPAWWQELRVARGPLSKAGCALGRRCADTAAWLCRSPQHPVVTSSLPGFSRLGDRQPDTACARAGVPALDSCPTRLSPAWRREGADRPWVSLTCEGQELLGSPSFPAPTSSWS